MFFLALSFYFWYCLYLAMLVRQVRRLHFFQSMKKRSKKISPNQTPPSNNDLAGLAGCLAGQPPACGGVGRKEGNPLQGLASAKPPSKKVVVDLADLYHLKAFRIGIFIIYNNGVEACNMRPAFDAGDNSVMLAKLRNCLHFAGKFAANDTFVDKRIALF